VLRPSVPLLVLAVLLGLLGVVVAWSAGPAPIQGLAAAVREAPALVAGLPALLVVGGIGRVLLALLAPGPLGSHRPGARLATWGASHLLGLVAAGAQLAVWAPDAAWAARLWLVGPWALIAAGRLATAPGAMVPRHPPPDAAGGRHAAAAGVVAALGIGLGALLVAASGTGAAAEALPLARAGREVAARFALGASVPALSAAAAWVAAGALVAHGLAAARRAPIARRLALAALAWGSLRWAPALAREPAAWSALLATAAAGVAIPWLRRADRRSLQVAALLLAGCLLVRDPPTALAGAAGLALASARPARALPALAVALLVVGGAAALGAASAPAAAEATCAGGPDATRLALGGALAALGLFLARRRAPAAAPVEPTRREVAFVALAAGGLVAGWGLGSLPLAVLAPLVALGLGLLVLPPVSAARPATAG